MAPQNPISRYLYDSWIQTCGVGWTPGQVLMGYVFSVLLAFGVLLAMDMVAPTYGEHRLKDFFDVYAWARALRAFTRAQVRARQVINTLTF